MVAYCNECNRYVNQYCDRCGDNFGISVCEKYGCGGTMRCPFCNGSTLSAKKEFGPDPYDYRKKSKGGEPGRPPAPAPQPAPQPQAQAPPPQQAAASSQCPMCGYNISAEWKYCPMCGVSFQVKK